MEMKRERKGCRGERDGERGEGKREREGMEGEMGRRVGGEIVGERERYTD